ncbi:MAG: hypothetical protein B7Y15_05740 [Bacteroidetes bacterium 24-39-8]|nr:MAG: hypothetical protein B7Y15_05740 [Bacteroidetes bacterium 24-39-8]
MCNICGYLSKISSKLFGKSRLQILTLLYYFGFPLVLKLFCGFLRISRIPKQCFEAFGCPELE